MSRYIHFTDEQKRQAAEVDLAEFLRQRGEKLLPSGREYRLESDRSVTVRGNRWYDHAAEQGGGPVSFLQRHCGMSYPEAVAALLEGGPVGFVETVRPEPKPPKPFTLPPAHSDMRRVYAYLMKQRQISREVISSFARAKLLYEDAEHHNAVFVGTDENSVPRHAHKRSTNSFGKAFRINVEGSDPRYSFHHVGTDGKLYVFEAPIDLLSFATLYPEGWEQHSYLALCGTGSQALVWMLGQYPQLREVKLCLDNDSAGRRAAERLTEKLQEMGYCNEILLPAAKDWNEQLCAEMAQERTSITMEMG